MTMNNIAMLASDTARTKAYIQMMAKEQLQPALCIVYTDNYEKMIDECNSYKENDEISFFDLNQPVLYTLKKYGINYTVVENKDINSNELFAAINSSDQRYFIYSGYGGYILQPHLFDLDKRYIHVHAGILPQYRGSTTVYYSMLQDGYIGATAIFLSKGIDEGEIIDFEKFGIDGLRGIDIDNLYEPYIRSIVLKKVLVRLCNTNELVSHPQAAENAETYYIIHPVLKHLALMGRLEK